jgi:hypothetical protein
LLARPGGWNERNIVERPEAVKARRLRGSVMRRRVVRFAEKAGKFAPNPAGYAHPFYSPPTS